MNPDELAKHTLARGQRYPFDAPDDWWQGADADPPTLPGDWATHAARGVIADLCDRGGIKRGFDGIDEAVRADIVAALAGIIRAAAPTTGQGGG